MTLRCALVISTILSGVLWPELGAAKTEKRVSLLGFSSDQSKAAWLIQVEEFAAKTRDRYSLLRVVDTRSNSTLGTYRYNKIKRVDARGKKVRVNASKLAASNPKWSQAAPESSWKSLERAHQFDAARLTASTTISVRPDPDVELMTRPAKEGVMEVVSGGNYLGYTLAMSANGRVTLGRYRHDARPGQRVSSRVEVLTSVAGDFIAVVNRFEIGGAGPDEVATLTYGKIVAATEVAQTPANEFVFVRTRWGWQKMTAEQERVWRQSHVDRVDLAQRLHSLATGSY